MTDDRNQVIFHTFTLSHSRCDLCHPIIPNNYTQNGFCTSVFTSTANIQCKYRKCCPLNIVQSSWWEFDIGIDAKRHLACSNLYWQISPYECSIWQRGTRDSKAFWFPFHSRIHCCPSELWFQAGKQSAWKKNKDKTLILNHLQSDADVCS